MEKETGQKLKILQVFGSLGMGGAESRMMDVYRLVDKDQVSFDFLSLSTEENQYYEEEIKKMGGRVIKISSPRDVGVLKHIKALRKIFREGQYQAVHAHTSYHCGLIMYVAKKERIPVRISHARTTGSKQTSKIKGLLLRIGRWLINKYSTNKYAISKQSGRFLFGNTLYEVVPNAIDLRRFNVDGDKKSIRAQWGVDGDAVVIGQVGRFDSMKNHSFSVNWFANFEREHKNSLFVFVGDGPLRMEIEKQCEELGIKEKTRFLGVREDVPSLLSAVDVLFFPSKYEGLGGVVLEAQAAGVPVVESDVIPEETDLGLGMIEKVSLNAPFSEWTAAVLCSLEKKTYTVEEINKAFEERGFSLEAVTNKYVEAYQGKVT